MGKKQPKYDKDVIEAQELVIRLLEGIPAGIFLGAVFGTVTGPVAGVIIGIVVWLGWRME